MPVQIYSQQEPTSLFNKSEVKGKLVSSNKYNYARSCFRYNFSVDTGSPADWGYPVMIDWAIMKRDLLGNVSDPNAFVTVYHGLTADGKLIRGFQLGKLDPNGNIIKPLDGVGQYPTHGLDGATVKELTAAEVTAWKDYQDWYFDRVLVRRFGVDPPTALDRVHNVDPKAVSFMLKDELCEMMDINISQNVNKTLLLVLSDYSIFHTDSDDRGFNGEDGFRHGICFHSAYMNGANVVHLLDNLAYVLPYDHRGTNLGHLCPPRCRRLDAIGSL